MPNNGTCEVACRHTMGRSAVGAAPTAQSFNLRRISRGRSLANYFRNKTSKANARMCRQLDLEERDNQTALLAQGE